MGKNPTDGRRAAVGRTENFRTAGWTENFRSDGRKNFGRPSDGQKKIWAAGKKKCCRRQEIQNNWGRCFFRKLAFRRSQQCLSVTDRFLVKSYCVQFIYFFHIYITIIIYCYVLRQRKKNVTLILRDKYKIIFFLYFLT